MVLIWREGYCFNQEEWIQSFGRVKKFMPFDCLPSSLITFTFQCSFLYLCLHVFASVLDKDSSELKVLAKINSKVEQAFDCSKDKSSSSYIAIAQQEKNISQYIGCTVHVDRNHHHQIN